MYIHIYIIQESRKHIDDETEIHHKHSKKVKKNRKLISYDYEEM